MGDSNRRSSAPLIWLVLIVAAALVFFGLRVWKHPANAAASHHKSGQSGSTGGLGTTGRFASGGSAGLS